MAESTDALHSAINHWHSEAVSGARDHVALRTSMRSLAADIDSANPTIVSAADRIRLRGKLETMVHAVGESARQNHGAAAESSSGSATISVFA